MNNNLRAATCLAVIAAGVFLLCLGVSMISTGKRAALRHTAIVVLPRCSAWMTGEEHAPKGRKCKIATDPSTSHQPFSLAGEPRLLPLLHQPRTLDGDSSLTGECVQQPPLGRRQHGIRRLELQADHPECALRCPERLVEPVAARQRIGASTSRLVMLPGPRRSGALHLSQGDGRRLRSS
jgi:hypothetical protein